MPREDLAIQTAVNLIDQLHTRLIKVEPSYVISSLNNSVHEFLSAYARATIADQDRPVIATKIGFNVFQVGSKYRLLKRIRDDGEMFFIRLQHDEFPFLQFYWADSDMVVPQKKVILFSCNCSLTERVAERIIDLFENAEKESLLGFYESVKLDLRRNGLSEP